MSTVIVIPCIPKVSVLTKKMLFDAQLEKVMFYTILSYAGQYYRSCRGQGSGMMSLQIDIISLHLIYSQGISNHFCIIRAKIKGPPRDMYLVRARLI